MKKEKRGLTLEDLWRLTATEFEAVKGRIGNLEGEVREGFKEMRDGFKRVDGHLERIGRRVEHHEDEIIELRTRMNVVESKLGIKNK